MVIPDPGPHIPVTAAQAPQWHIFKQYYLSPILFEPRHEISNNVVHVCATSKGSDQPAHTRSLIRAFACRYSNI